MTKYPRPLACFVIGATGSGKTAAAVEIARTLRSDENGYRRIFVINCDVLQFYSGLPIATNKASLEELTFEDGTPIPHYFMGFLCPVSGKATYPPTTPYHEIIAAGPAQTTSCSDEYDGASRYHVHDFVREVTTFLHEDVYPTWSKEGCAIIFCGGSNYYVQSLLFEGTLVMEHQCSETAGEMGEEKPRIAISVAAEGSATPLDLSTTPSLNNSEWEALRNLDPIAASQVHPNNTRRVARLLHIAQSGVLPSQVYAQQRQTDQNSNAASSVRLRYRDPVLMSDGKRIHPRVSVVWTDGDPQWLDQRLNARVDQMVSNGIVSEVLDLARHVWCGRSEVKDSNSLAPPQNRKRSRNDTTDNQKDDDLGLEHLCAIGLAIGFKEWLPLVSTLLSGEGETPNNLDHERVNALACSEEGQTCISRVKQATRRYAKQQVQWIRNRFLGSVFASAWMQQFEVQATAVEEGEGASAWTRVWRAVPIIRVRVDVALAANTWPLVVRDAVAKCVLLDSAGPAVHDAWKVMTCATVGMNQTDNAGDHPESLHITTAPPIMDTKTLHHCELCEVVMSGTAQWEAHVKSKRHRGALNHETLVLKQRALGREIPPRRGKQSQPPSFH